MCWCRGSVSERIFAPLVSQIRRAGGRFVSRRLAADVAIDDATGRVVGVTTRSVDRDDTTSQLHKADAVVFAIGITGSLLGIDSHT